MLDVFNFRANLSNNGVQEENSNLIDDSDTALQRDFEDVPRNVLTVHNVLASGTYICDSKLNLDKCCAVLGNSYYSPSEFPALRVDVKTSQSSIFTISLFESGRIQATGGCRPIEAKKAMMKIANRLRKSLNYSIKLQNFEIQNILAVYDVGISIPLTRFVDVYDGHAYYEPDRFPALLVALLRTKYSAVRIRTEIPPNPELKKAEQVDTNPLNQNNSKEFQLNAKFREIMLGDSSAESQTFSEKVGGYMISEYSKRSHGKAKIDRPQKLETVTTNVFSTGKITFTGAKSIRSLSYALIKIKKVMEQPLLQLMSLDNSSSITSQQATITPQLRARLEELQDTESLIDFGPEYTALFQAKLN